MRRLGSSTPVALLASLLIAAAPLLFFNQTASADPLLSRSLHVGTPQPGATTYHEYTYTIPTADTLGSIEFEYCVNTPFIDTTCVPPDGLDVSGATISNQTGVTGFAIHGSTTANKIVVTRPPSPNLALQVALMRFDNVVNNSTNNETVFVRITTYATDDASGAYTDEGAVVFATVSGVQVEGYVPPYLTFCTGITVSINCSTTNGDFINLGELSKTSANFGTSQYSGATNDPGGFSTTMSGTTMTSGNNIIPPLTNPGSSNPGTGQFGINLRANSNPPVGQNRSGSGTSVAQSGYNTPNNFKFDNQIISKSNLSTDFNRFTVSYLVNVPSNQPAGIYSATLTYIAVAAF